MNAITHPAPAFRLSSGSVELLKWIALVAMVVDHVNAVFFDRSLDWATPVGRIAFPLFALVVAYNLARPGMDWRGFVRRCVIFGLLALPVHAYLFSIAASWWPLNILWLFLVAFAVTWAMDREQPELALGIFLVGGALVEYWWPGVGLVVSLWCWFTAGQRPALLVPVGLSVAGLCVTNGNAWALLVVPLVLLVSQWAPTVPRSGRFFWWFYPLHLAVIAGMVLTGV